MLLYYLVNDILRQNFIMKFCMYAESSCKIYFKLNLDQLLLTYFMFLYYLVSDIIRQDFIRNFVCILEVALKSIINKFPIK